jgi:DUF4097 and DUF4098 domain-containing protein YvlB
LHKQPGQPLDQPRARPSQHVQVTTSTGGLAGTDLTVASLEANTSRGSITASFAQPPDRILARLDAGNVRLTVPATTYAVEATTPSNAGHITVDVPTDPASPRKASTNPTLLANSSLVSL